jgi:hypothetical protein
MFEKQYFNGFDWHNPAHKRCYLIWHDMKRRCNQPQNKRYDRYGARGIKVCEEWKNFQAFWDWSITHGYAENLTIDRINGDEGYSPDNCRWADGETQANNRSNNHYLTFNGKTQSMAMWAKETGISYFVIRSRLNRGWGAERTLTTPVPKREVIT